MLSALDAALAATALLAGITGTWSPCGLSTIDTLRAGGVHRGGRAVAAATTIVFAAGALAGGVLTFGCLGALGALVHHGGGGGATLALAVALAAALLDASGTRILPQVRRQVPEPWRRGLPVAVTAGLYGALLGLAFTTFVMSFAVWALAGMTVALGTVRAGLVVGLAFGAGRALPVLVIAPIADTSLGARLISGMTERAGALRGMRLLDALALIGCALALAGPAGAATPPAAPIYSGKVDPSVVAGELAWQEPGVGGFVRRGAAVSALPGDDPALGGGWIAWRGADTITIADRRSLTPAFTVAAPGADELAISAGWLAYRVPPAPGGPGRYRILVQRLPPTAPAYQVASANVPDELGRPALAGRTLVFGAAGRRSRIVAIDLRNGRHTTLRHAIDAQLLNPSVLAGRLLYVRVDDCDQKLLLGPAIANARDRIIASAVTQVSRDGGYQPGAIREGRTPNHCVGPLAGRYTTIVSFWTTALGPRAAYLTVLSASATSALAVLRRLPR